MRKLLSFLFLLVLSTAAFAVWTRTVVDTTNDLRAIHGYIGTNVVTLCAVGNGGAVWRSHNYGTTWTSITSSVIGTSINLSGVAVTENAIYAVGTGNIGGGKVYKYDNSTGNWSDITPSGTYNSISDVSFSGNKGIFIAGTPTGSEVRYTTNGGATWQSPTSPPPLGNNYLAAYYFADNSIWIAGSGGNIYKSTDGGQTWTQKNASGSNIQDIYFIDANNGFAVDDNGTFYYTRDGNTWTGLNISGSLTDLYGVFASDANTAWVAGYDPAPKVLKLTYSSTNNSWSVSEVYTSSTPTDQHYDIWGTDVDNMWVVGHGGSGIVVKSIAPLSVSSCTQKDRPTVNQIYVGFSGNLKISGTNFQVQNWNSKLSFSPSGINVNSVTRTSATELIANVSTSTSPGTYTGTLTNADGTTTTFSLNVTNPPNITSLSPATVKQGWIGTLTFTGTDFQTGATVFVPPNSGIDIIPGSINIKSTTEAECKINVKNVSIPNGQASTTVTFTLTNPDGGNDGIALTVEKTVSPPQRSSISFDNRIYNSTLYPSTQLISSTPKIKIVFTDSDGFSSTTTHAKIYYSSSDGKIWGWYEVDPNNLTFSDNNTKVTIEYQIPANAPLGGAITLIGGYLEDIYGNPGTVEIPVTIGGTGPTSNITDLLAGPNPSRGEPVTLQFNSPNDFSGTIYLLNSNFEKIYEIPVEVKAGINKVLWNLNTFTGVVPNGMVLYVITSGGKTLAKGKVVIAR